MNYVFGLMLIAILTVPKNARSDDLLKELASLRSLIQQSLAMEQTRAGENDASRFGPLTRYWSLIEQAGLAQRLDPYLINAVIKNESNYNAKAVSPKGALGLMQLMPGTARSVGVRDPFNPEQNINGGCLYLRLMLDQFGSIHTALLAYNAGPGRVSRGQVPTESYQYAARVIDDFRAMRQH